MLGVFEVWISAQEADMLTSKLFNFLVTAAFKDADLINLSFVTAASNVFDEVDGLTGIFIAKSSGNGEENGANDANDFRSATSAFTND